MPLAQISKGRHRSVFYFGGLLKARGAAGVSVEANFDAVAALMLLILIQDLVLLSALAVSYCLPLRTFSAPLLPHTNTLSGLESATKFNNRSEASPKNTPSAAQRFAFIWPLESRPEVQLSDSSRSLCLFFCRVPSLTPPAAGFDSAALWRMWWDAGHPPVCVPTWKCLRWTERQQVSGRVPSRNTCQSLQHTQGWPDMSRLPRW